MHTISSAHKFCITARLGVLIEKIYRLYYGWVIVAVSFFTLFFTLGIRFSFSVYYIAILEEYGWGRAETAGAFSLAMISHAIFAPVTGILIDRLGPRRHFPLGATILFLGLLAASQISAKWQLYLFFGVFMAVGINTLSYAPHMSIIPRWFIRKRGLASGIVVSGIGLGTLVLVPLNEMLIDTWGWRSAFLVLAGAILCILIPMTVLFHRRSPEEIGQYPDNIVSEKVHLSSRRPKGDASAAARSRLWTFKDATRTSGLWFIVLAVTCDGFIINVLLVHQAAYTVDLGYTKGLAAALVGILGLLGSVGGVLCGFLSDVLGSKKAYTMGSILSFIGLLFLILTKVWTSLWFLFVFVMLFGLGNGGKMPVIATVTGSLFPGNALGRIMAMQAIGFGIGGAIGAYAGGYFHDQMGTYFVPFLLLLAGVIIGMMSIRTACDAPEGGKGVF